MDEREEGRHAFSDENAAGVSEVSSGQLELSGLFRNLPMILCKMLAAFLVIGLWGACGFGGTGLGQATDLRSMRPIIERLISTGQVPVARTTLANVKATADEEPLRLYLTARILFKEKHFNESLVQLGKGLELQKKAEPSHTAAAEVRNAWDSLTSEMCQLSGLNYVHLDRLDLAEPFLNTAVTMQPGNVWNHYHLGMLLYSTSRFGLAVHHFRQAIQIQPRFGKAYDALGLVREEIEGTDSAIQAYRTAIALNEQQGQREASPYFNLGRLLLRQDRPQESLPLLEAAVELNSISAEAFYLLGKALYQVGREKDAVRAMQQSARLDVDFPEPHYFMSRIYLKRQQTKEARKEAEIFRQLDSKRPKKQATGRKLPD